MGLGESMEDYLEAVLILGYQNGKDNVRSIDVVRYLNVSKPSVSHAVKELRKKGYLTMEEYGFLYLTDKGTVLAEKIYERHCFFSAVLITVGVSEDVAVRDACRIEHYVSVETFEKLQSSWNRIMSGQ